jgi:hypothetical protein
MIIVFATATTAATTITVTVLLVTGPTEIGVVTNVGREDLEIMTGAGVVKRIKPEVYYANNISETTSTILQEVRFTAYHRTACC